MASRWFRHPATWIFAPTALALLYYAAHALFAPQPTHADLPPGEAVLVQRFRSLAAFDRMQADAEKPPSVVLGEDLNIPGLPGIDRAGPLYLMQLPLRSTTPRSLAVLSVEDEDAVDARFHDVELIEKGLIRRAQHLHVAGGWASFSPDRDVARRIGEGGITARERDEDFSLAADVPGLIAHALTLPRTEPWQGLLQQMGVRLRGAYVAQDSKTPRGGFSGIGHLRRLETSWAAARMWAWFERDGNPFVEVVVDTLPGPVRDVLAALTPAPADTEAVPVPRTADAWIHIPDRNARVALVVAAFSLGFSFGHDADAPADAMPLTVAALSNREGGSGGLAVWTEPSMRAAQRFDVGAAAPAGSLPDPKAWLPGDDVTTRTVDGFDVAAGGRDGKRVLDRYRAALVNRVAAEPWAREAGERPLATLHVSAARARAWLGGLIEPGGMWALFQNRDLLGHVTTDGKRLRVRIRGVAPGS